MTVAQDHLDAFAVCYQKAVDRLDKVRRSRSASLTAQIVNKQDYPSDYVYYKVPVPWLQVKLLRLLQYYPPSGARSPYSTLLTFRRPDDPTHAA